MGLFDVLPKASDPSNYLSCCQCDQMSNYKVTQICQKLPKNNQIRIYLISHVFLNITTKPSNILATFVKKFVTKNF